MSSFSFLLIGLFLPLFPFSIGFNFLLRKVKNPILKSAFLAFWPILGLALFYKLDVETPLWVLGWAAFTSLLYAYRLLTERDMNAWTGFLATSVWSLFWIPLLLSGLNVEMLMIYALGYGIPLTMVLLLANELKQRYDVAYTHLYGGLAQTMPRFSSLLIFVILASIATPVFPSFFIMLKTVLWTVSNPIITVILLLIWLLWSWAGIRIIQGLLIGPADQRREVNDISRALTWNFVLILMALAAAGLFITGDLL